MWVSICIACISCVERRPAQPNEWLSDWMNQTCMRWALAAQDAYVVENGIQINSQEVAASGQLEFQVCWRRFLSFAIHLPVVKAIFRRINYKLNGTTRSYESVFPIASSSTEHTRRLSVLVLFRLRFGGLFNMRVLFGAVCLIQTMKVNDCRRVFLQQSFLYLSFPLCLCLSCSE